MRCTEVVPPAGTENEGAKKSPRLQIRGRKMYGDRTTCEHSERIVHRDCAYCKYMEGRYTEVISEYKASRCPQILSVSHVGKE